MDRESDLSEGNMEMCESGLNIQPPLRGIRGGTGSRPMESRIEEITKGAKKYESPQSE